MHTNALCLYHLNAVRSIGKNSNHAADEVRRAAVFRISSGKQKLGFQIFET